MAAAASAQVYPSRPVTLIVPFPAGGGADAMARITAEPGEVLDMSIESSKVPKPVTCRSSSQPPSTLLLIVGLAQNVGN